MKTAGTDLVISKDELEQHARKFRHIAKLLNASPGDDVDYSSTASWMMTLADQFMNAACGYDPYVETAPYDKPPEVANG